MIKKDDGTVRIGAASLERQQGCGESFLMEDPIGRGV